MVAYGRLAAHPETEAVKDVWDLGVFGAVGPLSFVGSTTNHGTVSTQTLGLRHTAQVWAAEALAGSPVIRAGTDRA